MLRRTYRRDGNDVIAKIARQISGRKAPGPSRSFSAGQFPERFMLTFPYVPSGPNPTRELDTLYSELT